MQKSIKTVPWKIGLAYYGRMSPNSKLLDLEEDSLWTHEALNSCCLQSTMKLGGISCSAVGLYNLSRSWRLTAKCYWDIIRKSAISAGHRLIGEHFICQQDNNSKHSARIVKKYLYAFTEQGVAETMDCRAQTSTSLHIHMWDYLERAKQERNPTNVNGLFTILEEEWTRIPQTYITKLDQSLNETFVLVL